MTYSRRNSTDEQQEACQKARQITAICGQFQITLDPIDWQQFGMWAPVKVNTIEIASLLDLRQRGSDDILRQVQIKLFAHAAFETLHARPGLKALMWSPVDVVQPQAFLSLWIITLETEERIPIIETISNGQRVYEHYQFDRDDGQQLARLFGPVNEGEYHLGDTVTIKERERHYTGEIIYIIPPGKMASSRKDASRGLYWLLGSSVQKQAFRNGERSAFPACKHRRVGVESDVVTSILLLERHYAQVMEELLVWVVFSPLSSS